MPSENFTSRSQVPAGYKIAARKILKGEAILKYNVTVGFANVDIEPGTMVHSHNTEFREFDRDYAHASEFNAGATAARMRSAPPSRAMSVPTAGSARAISSACCRP